jgi:hypothetical protein
MMAVIPDVIAGPGRASYACAHITCMFRVSRF